MKTALYYPFTHPANENFIKTALFLWDAVDFIVPYEGFHPYGIKKEEEEAYELVGRSYIPTETDKQAAHQEFEEICTSEVTDRFLFSLGDEGHDYEFYPEKLLPETWKMLSQSRLAKISDFNSSVYNAATNRLFGYYMMSVLAVCCSHGRKRLVTDDHDPYIALSKILSDTDGCDQDGSVHEKLISMSLPGINFSTIPISQLISIRKNEDSFLKGLRNSFLSRVDETAEVIRSNAGNPNIIRDATYEFSRSMELDLKELKRALRRNVADAMLSKEFGISICAAVATASGSHISEPITTVAGGVTLLGGLTKTLLNYSDRRRKILSDHPSAWLLRTKASNQVAGGINSPGPHTGRTGPYHGGSEDSVPED